MTDQKYPTFKLSAGRMRIASVLLIAVLLLSMATPAAQAAPPQQDDQPSTLRIGYLGPAGTDLANGAQLAMDQINASGGIVAPDGNSYQLELVAPADGPVSVEDLEDLVGELVAANIVALLGPETNDMLTPGNLQSLLDTRLPILSAATVDTMTDSDALDTIFRIRAPEVTYSTALATYLLDDLGLTSIALVQTDIESTEALIDFQSAMSAFNATPADRIQVIGGPLTEEAQRLLTLNPEAVVMWGTPLDANNLLVQLRDGGWTGQFAYRYAEEAARANAIPDDLANGMLGVNGWSYANVDRSSRIFTRDYSVAFGEVPTSLSAAGYDTIWFLWAAVRDQGVTPEAIRTGLIGGSPRALVQGSLHPVDFANGDLSRNVSVYQIGPRGGSTVVARFDDTQRLQITDAGPVAQVPTATPALPVATPLPTGTLSGAYALVTANVLNVRSGPGFNFDKVGQVAKNDLLQILGATGDFVWILVNIPGGSGWVKSEYVQIQGDISAVGVVQNPPTPTLGVTLTPTLPPNPDIVIDNVVLAPAQPIPNRPFSATVTVRNAGAAAAGQFAVAGTFEPGGVYLATFVGGLAGGQSATVQLNGSLTGTGTFQVAVIADLNNTVPEVNETNNSFNITYHADYPLYAQQANVQLAPNTSWDLFGGTVDFVWDGYNIAMQNGAMIGVLNGITFEDATYDTVAPAVINNSTGLTTEVVNPGLVFGVITAEGYRAVARVDNRTDTTIWISYRVYNSTP